MAANIKTFSEGEILRAYRAHGNNMTKTAKALNTCRQNLYQNYIRKSENLRIELKNAEQSRVDLAIEGLDKALEEGEVWAINKVLNSAHGRKRGYGKHIEVTSEVKHSSNAILDAIRRKIPL